MTFKRIMANLSSKVSVVMCTYNGEKYLKEQLDSILAQTYPIHEIIVRDDCSTDGTMRILESYADRYSHIKVIRNESNMGCNPNFYAALKEAAGDYIAISDQDDIWFPSKIEKQLAKLSSDVKWNLCFSDIVSTTSYTETQLPDYEPLPYTAEAMLFRDNVPGHTMLLKRSFVERLADWGNTSFYYDWWLAMNAALEDSIVKCNEPLVWHRLHEGSEIVTTGKKLSRIKGQSVVAPYVLGIPYFFKLRKARSWQCFYRNMENKTSEDHHPELHEIVRLFRTKNPFGIFRLCMLCMKQRERIYPHPHHTKGFLFALRGFFAPFICLYYNLQFYKEV